MITLKTSLISSYTPAFVCGTSNTNFARVAKVYRPIEQPYDVGVDLYLFMEPDIRSWSKGSKKDERSAFQILGRYQDPGKIRRIGQHIRDRFESMECRPIAITSFIPEIAFKPGGANDPVDRAIENLMRFTLELCKYDPEPILQLVAGSLIDKVKLDKGKNELVAIQCQPDAKYLRILSRIHRSLDRLRPDYPDCDKLKLAFEVEPGPVHLLRNLQSVVEFVNAARVYPSTYIQKNVGLNLDLAHWYLAEEDNDGPKLIPQTLEHESYEYLRSRIFHSHISGHSVLGHFGDKPLTHIPDAMRAAFDDWLAFLRRSAPRFSGYVSLEFEMAPPAENYQTVRQSLVHLHEWLARVNALPL